MLPLGFRGPFDSYNGNGGVILTERPTDLLPSTPTLALIKSLHVSKDRFTYARGACTPLPGLFPLPRVLSTAWSAMRQGFEKRAGLELGSWSAH